MDETGFNRAMTRRYGRAPGGERAHGRVPQRGGVARRCLSLVGALGVDGLIAHQAIAGAFNRKRFVAFIAERLVSALRPGQTVVMDNLNVHHGAAVRCAIEAAGCRLVFLPRYSPDFSPIEPAWSKVKTALRALEARTELTLRLALDWALARLRPADARGWFAHCGYQVR